MDRVITILVLWGFAAALFFWLAWPLPMARIPL